MKSVPALAAGLALLAGVLPATAALSPDAAGWNSRCRRPLGSDNAPEHGAYVLQTQGKTNGARARALFDYNVSASARLAVYPTAEKDFLNPYSGARMSLGYQGAVADSPPHGMTPAIGHVSLGIIARDFKPIPGAVKIRLEIDGVAFGPWEPNPSSVGGGQYSVWLDTAETDGDGKPPQLDPRAFAALARALDGMSSAQFVLVRDGVDIARLPLSPSQRSTWRSGLAPWTSKTRPGVGAATNCQSGDAVLQ